MEIFADEGNLKSNQIKSHNQQQQPLLQQQRQSSIYLINPINQSPKKNNNIMIAKPC